MTKKKQNIQPQIKTFKLSEIQPAEYNPRTISDEALQGLSASIKRLGIVEPIIINVRDGKNIIIGGNQRFKVLMAAGITEAICITVDLDTAEEKLLNITLNNPHIQGEFTKELGRYIEGIKAELSDDKDLLALKIDKLQDEIGEKASDYIYKEEELKPYKKTHVLISFSPELLSQIAEHLEAIIKIEGIEYEQGSN